jgi:hypothetical protein
MIIIERECGLFHKETIRAGKTIKTPPFTKDQTATRIMGGIEETYCIYDDLISQGYELIEITQSKRDAYEAEQKRARSIAYLNSTDWYLTKMLETGQEVPLDIAVARSEARKLL